MKANKRFLCRNRASFPQEPHKGSSGGNESLVIPLVGKLTLTVELPANWRKFERIMYGTLNSTSGSIPFIGVARLAKDPAGKIESEVQLVTMAKLEATAGKAGNAILKKHFRNFFEAVERHPKSREAWIKALALDCATVAKDPAWLGEANISSHEDWKALKRAERKRRKTDDLDYLLANRYQAEGWNKLRMAEVGKICGEILKRKPFPATTIKDRTTALDLQTSLKPGAQRKVEFDLLVQEHLRKRK